MTEAEWLACEDPAPMLAHLRGTASDRKLRLFATACCRRVGRLLADERSRRAVDAAERYAEGRADAEELRASREAAAEAARDPLIAGAAWSAACAAAEAAGGDFLSWHQAAVCAAHAAASAQVPAGSHDVAPRRIRSSWRAACHREWKGQAALLRELVGNPFRPVAVASTWLSWNDGAVRKMAQTLQDDLDFGRLPLLADALEDAGCADAAILGHCRQPGEHVRGCWVIDLLLGRE